MERKMKNKTQSGVMMQKRIKSDELAGDMGEGRIWDHNDENQKKVPNLATTIFSKHTSVFFNALATSIKL
jgi:hypothetical protein